MSTLDSETKRISVALPAEVCAKLERLARDTERSRDWTAARLLQYALVGPDTVEKSMGEAVNAD
jgi:predicted transcriptional regulator